MLLIKTSKPADIQMNSVFSLDWLRGVAALMVCIFHVKKYVWQKTIPNVFVFWMDQGYLGVYIFFVVSGFVIPYSMAAKKYTIKSFDRFFLKRLIRIEPPYIIFILLLFLWNVFLHYTKGWGTWELYDIKKFILNVTYLAPFFGEKWIIIIFWTLGVEFQFYLLSGLMQEILMKDRIYRYGSMVFLTAIGFIIPKSYTTIFHFYPYFAAGFQAFLFYTNRIGRKELIISVALLSGWLFAFDLKEGALMVLLTVFLIFILDHNNRIAHFFGKISYSLYLTHGLAGGAAGIFLLHYFNKVSLFFISIGISILFAWLYYRLVEKPFLIRSKRINY